MKTPIDVMIFAHQISDLSARYELSVTSWWRSAKHNAAVGGAPTSLHVKGLAVDVVLDPGEDKAEFLQSVHDVGLHYLDEGDHIHIQADSAETPSLPAPSPDSGRSTPPEGGRQEGGVPRRTPGGRD
jgi:hypothetical protein